MSCGVMANCFPEAGFFEGFSSLIGSTLFTFLSEFFSQPAPSSTWRQNSSWPKVASSLPVWLKPVWLKVASLPVWLKPVWLKPVWPKVASLPVWLKPVWMKVASLPVWMKVASRCGFTSWSQDGCEAWVGSSDMEWKTESLVATSVEQQQAKPTEPADDAAGQGSAPQKFPLERP